MHKMNQTEQNLRSHIHWQRQQIPNTPISYKDEIFL